MGRWLFTSGLILISQVLFAADEAPDEASRWRLVPGAVPGTLRFAGSETSFGMGGRLETHATISDVYFSAEKSGRDQLRFAQIPVDAATGPNSQFRFNTRDSRLWFQLQHPAGADDFNLYVEYDMTGKPDTHKFFLRHAYVDMGPILVGRSFTTFIDSGVLPDVDTGSAPGTVTLKRDQIRWTQSFRDDSLELAAALEQPDSHITEPDSDRIRNYDDNHLPAIVSRLTWHAGWGQVALSSMIRRLHWQQNDQQLSKLAGGIGLSGRINLDAVDNLRFMINYGNGIGRFITLGAYADASIARDFNRLNPHPAYSLLGAYQHYWNSRWRSTLSLSFSGSSLPGSRSDNLTARARSAQVNLFWSPIPDLSIGIEYLHAQRQLANAQDGELNRLMFSTRYTFQL